MRRWVGVAAAAVVAVGVSTGVVWWLLSGDDAVDSAPSASVTAATTGGTDGPAEPAPVPSVPATVDPTTLVQLDDVWLLDGGDGSYDWGIVVMGGERARRDIDVTVRLEDATGSVVFTATDAVSMLSPGQRSAIGGTARALQAQPVRIEADVSVGFDADEPLDGGSGDVDVRAVERRVDPRSNDGSEVVAGRLRSTFAEPVDDLRLAAIWRAPADGDTVRAGDIVAVVFRDVERIRPGVDARFEIPVTGRDVPSGAPDEVLVTM